MNIYIYSSYIMNMYILGRLNGFGNGFPSYFFLNMWVSPDFGYVFAAAGVADDWHHSTQGVEAT